jgi:dTDP-4-amino-4,6-dideoxygalactose transaminase
MAMWVRKRLDIGWSDLAIGVVRTALSPSPEKVQRRVEARWSPSADALACFSVRSGFDLLLATLELPPKSEILMSAMTIPDMPRIVEDHGLVPVPIDLDVETLGPSLESLRRSITPASRAVVAAHLCGGRLNMEPILGVAREHRLLVIEDCAQAFDGRGYTGHPEADVSMFSFGPIKTGTALGGALLRVRDAGLRERMRARQAGYPLQKRRVYLCRLLKYAAFRALSYPKAYGLLVRTWRAMGRDYDRMVNGSVRGFPGPDFFDRIRQQPCGPLLAVLDRRLRTYDRGRLEGRAAKGDRLSRLLGDKVLCAGRAATPHNSWVFPIVVENPAEVIAALRQAGFDATQGHSMCVVSPPVDRPRLAAPRAGLALTKIVYLPIYPEMPDDAFEVMSRVVLGVAVRPSLVGEECGMPSQRGALGGHGIFTPASMPTRG